MPLPAALAAKLSKRGLIKDQAYEVEEVFAEDYDDPSADPSEKRKANDTLVYEMKACPNRVNIYHTCVNYCIERWGFKKFNADKSMDSRRQRMLRKYPLPADWKEVGDPNTGRYYYWNTATGQVSWLSPSHPRATTTLGKEQLLDMVSKAGLLEARGVKRVLTQEPRIQEDVIESREYETEKVSRTASRRDARESRRARKMDDLDPMDPASYSDIPRGTWTSGLELPGDAKTGVDATASGPLYQQRPYPSPGAVLRMNKAPE